MTKFNQTRREFIDKIGRIIFCAGLGYPTVIEPNWLSIERSEIPITKLPHGLSGLRIGLIADFHKGHYVTESDISRTADILQKNEPDLIILGGDFVEGSAGNIRSCVVPLSKLKAPLGVFAVLGNHDYWTNAEFVRETLQKFKIPVLMNESVKIRWNDDHFFLIGLDDAWMGTPNLKSALKGIPDEAMKVLVVHEPDYADSLRTISAWLPLQLSGHSHGGQFIVPFIGPVYLPYMGKKYPMGLKRVPGTDRWVYTTRGVGLTLPVRFNCKPEVSLLTLRSTSN